MPRFEARWVAGGIAILIAGLAPGLEAANEFKPRIPVEWEGADCMTVVDLDAEDTLHFDYAVPEEDLGEKTDDELDDSRTHQFFAFARHPRTAGALPVWVSRDDVDRADEVDPAVVADDVLDEEVLADHPDWSADEWQRITADDERVEISTAQAAMGFDWDLNGAEPGAYLVAGYTFEPVGSLWSLHPGVVKLRDASVNPPAAALDAMPDVLDGNDPIEVFGCADAPEGSTLELAWGVELAPAEEPEWTTFTEDFPAGGEDVGFWVDFEAPPEADGEIVRFRVEVRSPDGLGWVGYTPNAVQVMGHIDPDEEASGCGCRSSGPPAWCAWSVLALLAWRRRSRRSRAS